MKMLARILVATSIGLTAVTAWSGQTQQIAPGEVPEGITAEDWDIVQEAYLKASNTDTNDHFGCSVSISGDTIVVGAEDEESSATISSAITSGSTSGGTSAKNPLSI